MQKLFLKRLRQTVPLFWHDGMLKGYLTVFLALSLSIFTGFILFLTFSTVRNEEKIRFECAADIGMNAVLSEYHMELFERYGLLYVDASYLGSAPSVKNVEDRLRFYIEKNTSDILNREHAPWGRIFPKDVEVSYIETAAADEGASMRSQAISYAADLEIVREESAVVDYRGDFAALDGTDPLADWAGIMEQLAGMDLPWIQNELGLWEEVPLSNPADWVYGLVGSDVLYLAKADLGSLNPVGVELGSFISHRGAVNMDSQNRIFQQDEGVFLAYLFDKMGYFGNYREGSLLCCQAEYLAAGKSSDLENMKAVAERVFRWRFADNVDLALSDRNLHRQAIAAARDLQAVVLKTEFEDPVAKSILYACAFLESVSDIRALFAGETIPLRKDSHQMSVEKVLSGNLYSGGGNGGMTYSQYLAGMLVLMDEGELNMRAMDIMEMDIRYRKGNTGFCMDWCIERYEAFLTARGGMAEPMRLHRKYGYY